MLVFLQKNPWLMKVILGLVVLAFGVIGIEAYNGVSDTTVATVGQERVDLQTLDQVIQRLPENTPQARQVALDLLVTQRAFAQQAARLQLEVSDRAVQEAIAKIELFNQAGRFDESAYKAFLKSRKESPENFEARWREDLSINRMLAPLDQGALVAKIGVEQLISLLEEKREVSVWVFLPAAYQKDVRINEADIKKRYEAQRPLYTVPERVKVEYAVFSPQALLTRIAISPAAVKSAYEQQVEQYAAEQRQARHILFTVASSASKAQKLAVKTRAQRILAELRANPSRFPALAKAHSEDPGSADQGGDLHYFARGVMVKPFNDTVFSMKKGEISEPILTDFGYHIIELLDIRRKSFDEVKEQIKAELALKEANRQFSQYSETFREQVNAHPKTLQPAADRFGLKLEQSGWVTRAHADEPELQNSAVREAIFQADVLSQRDTTEVLTLADRRLLVARAVQYAPKHLLPLTEVAAAIRERLSTDAASRLASAAAAQQLKAIQKGQVSGDALWTGDQLLTRRDRIASSPLFSEKTVRRIFQLPAAKLPAYLVADLPSGGAGIFRVSKIIAADPAPQAQRKQMEGLLKNLFGNAELSAYRLWVAEQWPVKVYPKRLEKSIKAD